MVVRFGMEESLESGDAFAIPNLWRQSSLAQLNARELSADVDGLSPFRQLVLCSNFDRR